MGNNNSRNKARNMTIGLTMTALFMGINIALSSFGVPVPGGHLYLNDIIICLAAILLNPYEAFMVGGLGAFLGDMIFYPAPMYVSLVVHGLQAIVISLFSHKTFKNKPEIGAIIGVLVGAIIMVAGYTFGRAYIYATVEYAILKLPFQFLQAALGVVFGPLLAFKCGIKKLYEKTIRI